MTWNITQEVAQKAATVQILLFLPHLYNSIFKVTILKISVLFSLAPPVAISGNFRCVFGSHFPYVHRL